MSYSKQTAMPVSVTRKSYLTYASNSEREIIYTILKYFFNMLNVHIRRVPFKLLLYLAHYYVRKERS